MNAPRELPFVVDARVERSNSIEHHVSQHASTLEYRLATHGALLFRNFSVRSEREFEQAVLSLPGMRAMDRYFMSEPGRSIVAGTRYVFSTNDLYKTGGSWWIGGPHTENYYSVDVPRFISFFCLKPSWLGGETGLVDMAGVYADLDDAAKSALGQRSCGVLSFPVATVAKRYGVSADTVRASCARAGVAVVQPEGGEECILLFKPSVFEHPVTKAPAITANLYLEVKGVAGELNALLRQDYIGWRWALHRFVWAHPGVLQFRVKRRKGLLKKPAALPDPRTRVGTLLSGSDSRTLAHSMKRHFHSFRWRKGDVLIVDNMQVAHSGMPGLGPRLLRALLTNPLRMDLTSSSPGRQAPIDNPAHVTLATLLTTGHVAQSPPEGEQRESREASLPASP